MNQPTPSLPQRVLRAVRAGQRWRPPTGWWLVLALLALVLAGASWQGLRLDRMRPPAAELDRPPSRLAPAAAAAVTPAAMADPPPRPASVAVASGTDSRARAEPPATPATGSGRAQADTPPSAPPEDPRAGRLVLRCTTRGQVTYKDLNANCPNGAAERVTVFPTEGVGRPQ